MTENEMFLKYETDCREVETNGLTDVPPSREMIGRRINS